MQRGFPEAIMIGQLLDHYSVEAQLGAGGMGVVYKAFDVRLERPVAIKFLTYPSAGAVREILSEARVASALNHPHICTIHEVCEAAGQAFIVMEYVEGQTLREVIPLDGLAVESMVAYAIQIADGLAHAHDHGVIHRDLKSANIVITPDGRTKILDFGLALRFTPSRFDEISKLTTREDTNSDTTAGTPAYMAPEVLRGLQPDARSDVWALGVVLYEMLTGRLPFSGRNNAELCTEILREPPWPLRTSIDTGLRGVVLRCLMKEPRQRYQRASEVRAALETIQRQLEGAAPPSERAPSVPVRSNWRPTRKMKLTTGAVLAATVLFSLAIPQTRRMILPSSWLQRDGGSAERRSIAVFPFRSIGGDAEASLLAGGLSETLVARLFQSTALPIASGAAVERAAARGSTDTAARELGVDVLVTGTVQQIGSQLRVIVNLDDVKNGRRLWAQEISGSRSNLLSVEDRLLAGLLEALHVAPSEPMAASSPTSNTEAYNLYLKGMNALREKPGSEGAKAAIQFYEDAVRQDAGFALAYAAMSEAMLQIYREKKDRQLGDRAQYMAERARQLDPARPETHLAVGTVYNAIGGKGLEATAALKRALALSPNSDKAHRELGRAYAATGRGEDAIQSLRRAVEINPFDPEHYNALGTIANGLGRYSEAADAFRKVAELEPHKVRGYSNLGAMQLKMGLFDEAANTFQNMLKIQENPTVYTNLGITYANLGRFAEAVRMLQKAVDVEPNEARLVNLADGYRWLGDRGNADPIYDKAIAVAFQKLKADPKDAGTIAALALSSAKMGKFPQAMQYIAMARHIKPNDPDFIYYEATIQLLAGHIPQALASLRDAFRAGYSPAFARGDPDFRVLRADPSFEALMKEFRGGQR
jgi:serine/threonine-protein kinase